MATVRVVSGQGDWNGVKAFALSSLRGKSTGNTWSKSMAKVSPALSRF